MTHPVLRAVAGARIGLLLLIALVVVAASAHWIAPFDPSLQTGGPFEVPSLRHWLGTNDIGQDILSELIHATRVSLTIGVLTAGLATTVGTLVGMLAGSLRGVFDSVLMRLADLVLVVPFLPLVILLAAYLGPGAWHPVVVLGLLMWARPARIVRAGTLAASTRDHVLAARALGARDLHIQRHHLLPDVLPLSLAQFVLVASHAIALEAGLAFLGLGDPTLKSWGTMLFYAQSRHAFLTGAWLWWVVPPGVMIAMAVMSFALVGKAVEARQRL